MDGTVSSADISVAKFLILHSYTVSCNIIYYFDSLNLKNLIKDDDGG